MLAAILSAPEIAPDFESQLEKMACADPDHAALRDAILRALGDAATIPEAARAALGGETLETLLAARHLQVVPCLRQKGDAEMARMTVAEELAKLEAHRGWQAELDEAEEDLTHLADEALTWRLAQAAQARNRAGRPDEEDDADFEIGPNGALIDREERSAFDTLLSQIRFDKQRR